MDTKPAPPIQTPSSRPIGAVLVVGGGIGGMQAALDLADQGFKVYLVEEKSAIGGHMAQLDKTFPTNDCAMCTISPRLVDTGRHLNIEILTGSEVLAVQGEVGDFSVTVRRHPRYIDPARCVGCGDCAQVCPVSLPDLYEEGLKTRKAAYRLYTQAVPAAYAIEKRGVAPCRDGCPANQRAQGYIALIAAGRYKEAFRVIKEDNPFPSVCGRTCHHPCEGACTRALIDEPVSIMALKRFVVDYALAYGRDKVVPAARTRPEWIAVVGSGPAGLTAAHDLVRLGYGVTVYEALPVAGGMMRVGIPAHRLPKGILQQDIDDILALGVVLKTNAPIRDPAALLQQGYQAVCLATGISTRDHSLGIPGEGAQGVISAATFLRKINLGEAVAIGDRVVVAGGGITALDAAAVARRLGAAWVYLVLDRPRGELPAYQWEISAAEAEGIQMIEHRTVVRILTEGEKVSGVELAEAAPGYWTDAQGRRHPKTRPGSESILPADTVIATVGQFSDLNFLDPAYDDLPVDPESLATRIPGLFAVAGRKTGASYIIDAIALGHRVAASIHAYLQGLPAEIKTSHKIPIAKFTRQELEAKVKAGEIRKTPRAEPTLLPMAERVTSFREVVLGLTEHQARAEAARCLQCGLCAECLACVYACGTHAIDHEMPTVDETLKVGAVILAPGFIPFPAQRSEEFGFGRYPNVVTSLQFERLLSASGPTGGHIVRPSDRKTPHRIAFLQCIGSRDQEHDYCSAVCCMYATKEAMLAREHHPNLEVHIFLMDVRAYSKGFQAYFKRAERQYGLQYHRCRVSSLSEDAVTHDLFINRVDEQGSLHRDRFDMVVLSMGMEISESTRQLAQRLGVQIDRHGFCRTAGVDPLESSHTGIFAAGPFREPKDIPDTVIEASGAAGASAALLAPSRWQLTRRPEYPPERDVTGEPPRIGVFVCHCGSNIAGFLDVPAVTAYAARLPFVVHADHNLYACSQDSVKQIAERIQEYRLNRVVVASCSPLTHAPLFQDCLWSAGLNPYLFEMANIRNHCSWVHSTDWEAATQKAKDLVRMAVARAARLEPQATQSLPVQKAALVIGGGPAGMSAALTLADQGFPVHLIEREAELGGNLRKVHIPLPDLDKGWVGGDPQSYLSTLVERVVSHPHITVHLHTTVRRTSGFLGNFVSELEDGTQRYQVSHGVTILATGGEEYRGPEYGFGDDPRIMTQLQLEAWLQHAQDISQPPNSIAMILCVGPVESYCSRICCTVALKNAIYVKTRFPSCQVIIIFKDIRTYGFKELLYEEARRKGILFLRYDDTCPPQVETSSARDEPLRLRAYDAALKAWIELKPDLIALSMPVVPAAGADELAKLFKAAIDSDGFLSEAHIKLRPVDSATAGVFYAGMAHYPKLLEESVIQAKAAAARAARMLSQEQLTKSGSYAVVDPALCTGCLTCVRICPFEVPKIRLDLHGIGDIQGAAYIEPAICQGCGSCVAECPARAIQLMHYTDVQMRAKTLALVETEAL